MVLHLEGGGGLAGNLAWDLGEPGVGSTEPVSWGSRLPGGQKDDLGAQFGNSYNSRQTATDVLAGALTGSGNP